MARLARIVIPDVPHHVTQRGNRRQPVFFDEEDYAAYGALAAEACASLEFLSPDPVNIVIVRPNAIGGSYGIVRGLGR